MGKNLSCTFATIIIKKLTTEARRSITQRKVKRKQKSFYLVGSLLADWALFSSPASCRMRDSGSMTTGVGWYTIGFLFLISFNKGD